jgi:pilus assembly protein Flp/PilA
LQFIMFALLSLKSRLEARVEDQKERGATAVEYGLLVALIAAVIVVVVGTLGQKILAAFNLVVANLP